MISKFFIERPVLANVLAIVIVLIGTVALVTLPVAQYPNVVPPTVQVTTTYPGASADTLVNNVALPIELQVNGVENMIYMSSTSNVVDELARVPGVGNRKLLGVGQYSMRIWMDPQKLFTYQLAPNDVINVVKSQSQPVTAGQVGTPPAARGQDFQYTVDIQGQL